MKMYVCVTVGEGFFRVWRPRRRAGKVTAATSPGVTLIRCRVCPAEIWRDAAGRLRWIYSIRTWRLGTCRGAAGRIVAALVRNQRARLEQAADSASGGLELFPGDSKPRRTVPP